MTAPPTVATLGLAPRAALAVLFALGIVVGLPSGFGVFWFIPYAGVGTLLAIRRPGTTIGWLVVALGWALTVATVSVDATAGQFTNGGLSPAAGALAVVQANAGTAGFLLVAVLAMVFPSGRLPAGQWARPARAAIAIGVLMILAGLVMPRINANLWASSQSTLVPNPAAVLPDLPIWQILTPDTTVLPLAVIMVISVGSLVVRSRRATGVERQQIRWITTAFALLVAAVVGGYVVGLLVPDLGNSGVVWLGAVVAFPAVPAAIGIAVLRYRLYEIDRIISRTIGWVAVTSILASVFGVVIVGLQAVLAPITESSTLAVAASTLVAAALFQPLRGRIQHAVDRRFNRSRVDAERAAASFATHMRSEVDLDTLRLALVATAGDAVHPTGAAMWLRPGAQPPGRP